MPLFQITNTSLVAVEQENFDSEKRLQRLIEANLKTVFSCRLVASEFPTGALHAGRIDTLALSEDDNPVIIEYKKAESSELINQGLFYLHWLQDHHGDFELAARKVLSGLVEVDWSEVRVICIAPNYKKFDLHAVQVMGANIELWRYRFFKNSCIYLEEVYRRNLRVVPESAEQEKDPVMVAAGKKAAQTRATGVYTFEQHLEGKPQRIIDMALAIRDFISALDSVIEEMPKKFYIAYKISQNIVCMEVRKQGITLYLNLLSCPSSRPSSARRIAIPSQLKGLLRCQFWLGFPGLPCLEPHTVLSLQHHETASHKRRRKDRPLRRTKTPDALSLIGSTKADSIAWRRALGGVRVPRGVHRFKTHEEADQWLWRMITRVTS